jgi:hypothetical protein
MKKVKLFFIKSLMAVFVCYAMTACNESAERVSFYDMHPVSRYERGSLRTMMSHNERRNVNKYELYEEDSLTCVAHVAYRADGIICTLNDIQYHVQPDNVLGATRVRMVTANKDGALHHEAEYFYYNERLAYVRVNAPGVPESPFQVNFYYDNEQVTIQEPGGSYTMDLSSEENTGYACNVLGCLEAPLTNRYVIHPELYFLNIYGRPIDKLPGGHEIIRSDKTLSVGTHTYEYRH